METREPASNASAAGGARARRGAEHWLVLGATLAALVVLVAAGLFLEPDERGYGTHERLGLLPCMPMELWNVPCPGCGVTTSVTHAARGEIWSSIRTQPFGFLVALGMVGCAGWAVVGHLCGRDLWSDTRRLNGARWLSVGAFLLALAWMYKLASVRGWL